MTAAAHKFARLNYTMPPKGEEYRDHGQEYYKYKERYLETVLWNLTQRAERMDMRLVASEADV